MVELSVYDITYEAYIAKLDDVPIHEDVLDIEWVEDLEYFGEEEDYE